MGAAREMIEGGDLRYIAEVLWVTCGDRAYQSNLCAVHLSRQNVGSSDCAEARHDLGSECRQASRPTRRSESPETYSEKLSPLHSSTVRLSSPRDSKLRDGRGQHEAHRLQKSPFGRSDQIVPARKPVTSWEVDAACVSPTPTSSCPNDLLRPSLKGIATVRPPSKMT